MFVLFWAVNCSSVHKVRNIFPGLVNLEEEVSIETVTWMKMVIHDGNYPNPAKYDIPMTISISSVGPSITIISSLPIYPPLRHGILIDVTK